ncbi:hypothetical protein [Streptomyces sp. AD55]|uniref:hypothetical protein n=1 Tax=Streptomyces sp. AD55 TaxID=3242895 RepID=UPI00352730AF
MTFEDGFVADLRPGEAPAEVILDALRWELLNDWTRYLNDDRHPDKTAEKAYVWGFINGDFGCDALRCLWGTHETNYPMFAETVWLLHREFSEGAGADVHPLFANVPPIPADILFRKIASASAPVARKLTEHQMLKILRKAPQDYASMR